MLKNSLNSYGSVSKFLHWLIFFLVSAALILGFFFLDIDNKPLKLQLINLHKLLGLSILVIILFRLLWTFYNLKPLLPNSNPLERFARNLVHALLYLFLIAMPLTGWIFSTANNHAPKLFALSMPLPFVHYNKSLSAYFEDIHSVLAWTLLALIALHVLAALKHYFVNKDGIMERMF